MGNTARDSVCGIERVARVSFRRVLLFVTVMTDNSHSKTETPCLLKRIIIQVWFHSLQSM